MMKRILSFAAVAMLCIAAAVSCKNAGKGAEPQPAETEAVVDAEDTLADPEATEEIAPVEDPDDPDAITYAYIEVKPKFMDGDEKTFQQWIADNVQYPLEASDNGQTGTVVTQFTVDKEGKITDVKVLRSVYPALDAEAVRVIESAPSWTPGSHEGNPIDVSYVLPVKFEIR